MAFTFGFYNSLDHDRTYTAEQMGAIFDGVIEDGVFSAIGEAMKVSAATGMSVDVGTGRAWFNHTWSLNDSKYRLTLDASDVTMQRIDAVVLEVDTTTAQRKNSLKIVKGTPMLSNPQRPTLYNSNGIFQHALAYITVPANASAIVAGNIANVVGQGVAASGGAPFVTAPLNHVDISTLFTQWDGQFDAWFTDVKNQLSGSVVTNLQNQITANKTAITALQNADTTLQSQITANKTSIGNIGSWETIAHNDFDASATIKTYTHSCVFDNYFLFFLAFEAGYNDSRYEYWAGYLYLGDYPDYIVGGYTVNPGIFGFMLLDKTNSIYIIPYVKKSGSNSSTACLSYNPMDLPTTAWNGNKLLLQSANTGPYRSGYSSYVYGLRKK